LSSCVLDTGVVIAALDRSDARHRDAAKAIPAMIEERIELLVSTVNFAEALVRPAENEGTLRTAVNAIAALGLRPTAPTAAIARDASGWRGSLKISLADAFSSQPLGRTRRASPRSIAAFDEPRPGSASLPNQLS
jgi:predicted nucleic acid-binding protein